MGIDITARAMAAAARSAAQATNAPSAPIGRFADLHTKTIDPLQSAVITSGNTVAGIGRGVYVADAAATAALASAHPRFCKADAGGRYFRLLPDDEGLIPVACGGAIGFTSEPADSATPPDDRAAIAAAEAYRHAIGAAGLRFDARRYAYWRIALPEGTSYYDANQFVPFRVRSSAIWKSTHPAGTDLYRRKPTGQRPDLNDRELPTVYGAWFRGGCIWIEGTGTPGVDADPGADINSFTLDGIRLQGGLLQSTPGLTFEILDKGVWQQNDLYCGNLTFRNKAGIIGYASELVYASGGNGPSAVKRTLTIDDDCVFGETPGSCLNVAFTLKVGRCLCYNSTVGYEGWTGENGFIRAIFRNTGGSIQGGTVRQASGEHYYLPTDTGSAHLPIGNVDIRLEKSSFHIGSWISGRVEAIDSTVAFGNGALFPAGSRDVDLEVVLWCHSQNVLAGVAFNGAEPLGNCNIHIRLDLKRTKEAQAAGYKHSTAVWGYGSLGPNVQVDIGVLYDEYLTLTSSFDDYQPVLKGFYPNDKFSATAFDVEANNGGTLPNSPIVWLNCSGTATGTKNANLPTANVAPGTRIYVANMTRNNVNPALPTKINGSNFRSGIDENINGDYTMACFEFTGSKWRVVERV